MDNCQLGTFVKFFSIGYRINDFCEKLLIYIPSCYMPDVCFHIWQEMEPCPSFFILDKEMGTYHQ